jgi:O-antigen/teichoic acid export membrane protein
MRRLLVRRSLTGVGMYAAVVLGFLGTVVATREFQPRVFGDYATVIFATSFIQSLFDLTVEEAVVKYGFRYSTREDWGRFRRLFASALRFKLAGSGLAGSVLFLRSRYDLRSLFLAWSMALRLAGIAVGARFGLAEAIAGVLAAQVASTISIGVVGRIAFLRFPRADARPLGEDRREIGSFILQSSAATGVLALRGGLAPLLLGVVTSTTQVGLFRVAQSPQSGFQALSAPARMVLLTEQTRDWERGLQASVLRGVRRYSLVAVGISILLVPPLLVFIPDLIRRINGPQYLGAVTAARLFILAAAVQLVVGWTKSLPVTIGRPGLRIVTHGLETIVVLPLVIVLGARWGAAGAAGAVLAGMCVFALAWAIIFARIRPEDVGPPTPLDEALAETESEAGALVR